MINFRTISWAFMLLCLVGCEELPVVSDFNGASVKIQQSTFITPPDPKAPGIEEEAQRICNKIGKNAEYASTRSGPNAAYAEHLFLCL